MSDVKLNFIKFNNFLKKNNYLNIILGFLILLFFNLLVSFLTDKNSLRLNLMEVKAKYKLSNVNVRYLKRLNKRVNITVLCDKEGRFCADVNSNLEYSKNLINLLQQCVGYTSNIKLNYLRGSESLDFIKRYPKAKLHIYDISFTSANKIKKLQVGPENVLLNHYQELEDKIVKSVIQVSFSKPVVANVILGYKEESMQAALELLKINNYKIVNKVLSVDNIDADARLVLIYAPNQDFPSNELGKIENYLNSSTNFNKVVLYVANCKNEYTKNIAAFLNRWGINLEQGFVIDNKPENQFAFYAQGQRQSHPGFCIPEVIDNFCKLSSDLSYGSVVLPFSQPLSLISNFKDAKVRSLLEFAKTSCAIPLRSAASPDLLAKKGNRRIPAFVLSNRGNSNLLVLGSFEFFSEHLLENMFVVNAEYFVSLVNKVTGQEDNFQLVNKLNTQEKMLLIGDRQCRFIRTYLINGVLFFILGCWGFYHIKRHFFKEHYF